MYRLISPQMTERNMSFIGRSKDRFHSSATEMPKSCFDLRLVLPVSLISRFVLRSSKAGP